MVCYGALCRGSRGWNVVALACDRGHRQVDGRRGQPLCGAWAERVGLRGLSVPFWPGAAGLRCGPASRWSWRQTSGGLRTGRFSQPSVSQATTSSAHPAAPGSLNSWYSPGYSFSCNVGLIPFDQATAALDGDQPASVPCSTSSGAYQCRCRAWRLTRSSAWPIPGRNPSVVHEWVGVVSLTPPQGRERWQ